MGSDQGTIDERLGEVYLDLSHVSHGLEFPQHLRADLETLMRDLAALHAGSVSVDAKRASRLAKQVVAIYDRVTKELQ